MSDYTHTDLNDRKKRKIQTISSESEVDNSDHDDVYSDFAPQMSDADDDDMSSIESEEEIPRKEPVLALATSSPASGMSLPKIPFFIPNTPEASNTGSLKKSHSSFPGQQSSLSQASGKAKPPLLGSLKNPRFQSHVSTRGPSSSTDSRLKSGGLPSISVSESLKSSLSFYRFEESAVQEALKSNCIRRKNTILESPDVSPTKPSSLNSTFPAQLPHYTQENVVQVKEVFPNLKDSQIHEALAKKKGNVTDAIDLLMASDHSNDEDELTSEKEPLSKFVPLVEQFLNQGKKSSKSTTKHMVKSASSTMVDLTLQLSDVDDSFSEASPVKLMKRKGLKKKSSSLSTLPDTPIKLSEPVTIVSSSPIKEIRAMSSVEKRALTFFNSGSELALTTILSCSSEQAIHIMKLRPYDSVEDLESKFAALGAPRGKKRDANGASISSRSMMALWSRYIAVLEGYEEIDDLIDHCENLGAELDSITTQWASSGTTSSASDNESFPLLSRQPALVNSEFQLKSYQLLGVSWLNLLYQKNLGGILADEMGLGKTAQVISFLALLLEKGEEGPHMIIVPASTLENWRRELNRWCPSLIVKAYHGSMSERREIAESILYEDEAYHVLLTTYNLATGSKEDRSFLRKCQCQTMILDEGHMIKNVASARHKHLMALKSDFRLLLTGTPLQNNLMELIALLMFIMPDTFIPGKDSLERIFQAKHTFDNQSSATDPDLDLPRQRIERAKVIMNPFILRRKKNVVLKDLPQKTREIIRCSQTQRQSELYQKTVSDARTNLGGSGSSSRNSKAVMSLLMELRKIANHPLLVRSLYDESTIKKMATCLMRDPEYFDANKDYLIEDMSVMSDFELHSLCLKFHQTLGKFQLQSESWMEAGKVKILEKILREYQTENETAKRNDPQSQPNRLLIFSQFVIMLDVLESVLNTLNVKFVRIDGGTPVSDRQLIIDQFTEDTSILVFLLTTKSGGVGINLACANVVLQYDLDFNPHNDAQAEDRAYRLGQTRNVRVIKLITENSVEEHIYSCAESKLKLDEELQRDSTDSVQDRPTTPTSTCSDNETSKENLDSRFRSPMKALHLGDRNRSPTKQSPKKDIIDLSAEDGVAASSHGKRGDVQDKIIDLFWTDLMKS